MDRNEIAQLAQLAKLSFTDEQLDAFTDEFSSILAFVDQLPKQAVIELAPETDGDGFLIPRIV